MLFLKKKVSGNSPCDRLLRLPPIPEGLKKARMKKYSLKQTRKKIKFLK